MVDVKYAEMDITGSPFCVDVFDPSQVRVGHMPQGILGKCFQFERKSLLFGVIVEICLGVGLRS